MPNENGSIAEQKVVPVPGPAPLNVLSLLRRDRDDKVVDLSPRDVYRDSTVHAPNAILIVHPDDDAISLDNRSRALSADASDSMRGAKAIRVG